MLDIEPCAVAAVAAAGDFFDMPALTALLAAAAVHELGHVMCLAALGVHISGFRVEAQGLCIEYSGTAPAWAHALAAFCGPAAGIACAFLFSALSRRFAGGWPALAAGFSLLLSLFNFLPIPPLDGSKIFNAVLPEKIYFKIMKYEQFIFIALIALVYSGLLDKPLGFLQGKVTDVMIFLTNWVDIIFSAVLNKV